MLSDAQIERYSRQIILPQLGGKGQEKFLQSRILVNGSGAHQTMTLLYLAAAGVGTIGVSGGRLPTEAGLFAAGCDNQTLRAPQDSRADEPDLVETLTRLNPDCQVVIHSGDDTPAPDCRGEQFAADYDLVVSEPNPLLDVCYTFRRAFVCSWRQAASGRLFVWTGDETGPCFHCVPAKLRERDEANSEQTKPISERLAGIDTLADLFFGAFQATEALKCLIGLGASAHGKVFECEFPDIRWNEHAIHKDPSCVQCGQFGGQPA